MSQYEQIGNIKDESISFTPASGIQGTFVSITKHGKQVCGTIIITASIATETWTTIGTLSSHASDVIYAPIVLINNGNYVGMARIHTDVKVYLINSITDGTISFSVCFKASN